MDALEDWKRATQSNCQLDRLFEHIPNLMFFVKDTQSRIVAGNQRFLEHCGFASIDKVQGKFDYDIFPYYMAQKFSSDDRQVVATRQPLLDLIELFPKRDGLPEWFVTHKYPIFDNRGTVTGICGIVQNYEGSWHAADGPIITIVNHIKAHYRQALSIPDLCQRSGLSQRQIERLFKRRFRITPREYIIRFRILVAAEQLHSTDRSITQIALDCGFYDHSSFTRYFKRHMGKPPSHYRAQR